MRGQTTVTGGPAARGVSEVGHRRRRASAEPLRMLARTPPAAP